MPFIELRVRLSLDPRVWTVVADIMQASATIDGEVLQRTRMDAWPPPEPPSLPVGDLVTASAAAGGTDGVKPRSRS